MSARALLACCCALAGCGESGEFVGDWAGTLDVALTRTTPIPEALSAFARYPERWAIAAVGDALRDKADFQVTHVRDGEPVCLLEARFTERGRVSLAEGQSCLFGSALSTLNFGRLEGGATRLFLRLSWNWSNPNAERGTFMETGHLEVQ
jgi:hypothetical protein